jgi:hypothetical protein
VAVDTLLMQGPGHVRAAAPAAGPFSYSLYGLRVRSDLRLPIAPLRGVARGTPDLVFRRGVAERRTWMPNGPVVAELRGQDRTVYAVLSRDASGAWIQNFAVGRFHIATDARRVDVYPEVGVDERLLAFVLAGEVSVFVLQRLGYPSLHASAVVTGQGAVAFLGPKGQGKSTMAACFLRHGAALLTDDVLPLQSRDDGVYGTPSLPMMKVWPATVECTLELVDQLPNLIANYDKKLLVLDERHRFAQAPARLRAVYVLRRYDPTAAGRTDVFIQRLSGREALTALLAQTSFGPFLQPAEAARLLPLYARLQAQAPMRVLSVPNGFEYQAAVHAQIVTDLESR